MPNSSLAPWGAESHFPHRALVRRRSAVPAIHTFMSVQLTAKQQRRRKNARAFKREREKHAKIAARKPLRDAKYLAFIRSLRCAIDPCAHSRLGACRTEAAHVGDRGLGQKCSDYEAIPLCAWHHRLSPLSHHRAGKRFWKHHNLNREALIAAYRLAYKELNEGEC